MTTPSLRAGSTNSAFSTVITATSALITPGSAAVSGDFGVFVINVRKTTDPGALSTPTGWTKVNDTYNTSLVRSVTYYRTFDGTANDAPGTITWTATSGWDWSYAAYQDGTFDLAGTGQLNAASTTPQVLGLTTTAANDLVIGTIGSDAAVGTTISAGTSGFTVDVSSVNTSVTGGATLIGSKVFASAGATGNYNFGLSAAKVSATVSLALKPASGGGGGGSGKYAGQCMGVFN